MSGFLDYLRKEYYTPGREKLARFADLLGGQTQGGLMDPASGLHEVVSYNLTKKLGKYLPPEIAANVADLGGLANETLTGSLQKATDRPFMSESGFDFGDVAHNRIGQEKALGKMYNKPDTWKDIPLRALQDLSGLGLINPALRYMREGKFF